MVRLRSSFIAACLLVCLLCAFLFFHRLGNRDLWSSHEARAAMDAQSLLDDGDWIIPHLYDGQPELQKPPLYYWLVAIISLIRGGAVDAWAVRLPAAFSAGGCVLLLCLLGRARGRPVAGLLAGVILATAVHYTWLARIGRTDMPLTLMVAIAATVAFLTSTARSNSLVAAANAGISQNRFIVLLQLVAWLAIAAGVLLKGPIAIVLPAAIVMSYWIVERVVNSGSSLPADHGVFFPVRSLTSSSLIWGVPLVLALTVPWFLWANVRTDGELFRVFVWHHNFERGFGGSRLRGHPWWFYGPQFLVDFLPWSPLVLSAAVYCWRRGWWREDSALRFGAVWFLAVLAVLSCSRFKRADYLLPAYPGAALFLGCVAERLIMAARPVGTRWLPGLAGGLCLVMAAGWGWKLERGLPAEEASREYHSFATRVRDEAPRPGRVIFFRTEAHALAFHVGRPLSVFLEWEWLRECLAEPGPHWMVTPATWLPELAEQVPGVHVEEIARHPHLAGPVRERPLVLVRVTRRGSH